MAPRAREFIAALIQMPEWSGSGEQMQSQAVLSFVEGPGRVGWGATGGAITREITQSIDRTVRHLPVAGTPCDLMCQE